MILLVSSRVVGRYLKISAYQRGIEASLQLLLKANLSVYQGQWQTSATPIAELLFALLAVLFVALSCCKYKPAHLSQG